MLLIRRFEERTEEQYTRARIGGYCHLAIGEEAANVGAIEPLGARRLRVRELPRPRHGAGRRLRAARRHGRAVRQGHRRRRRLRRLDAPARRRAPLPRRLGHRRRAAADRRRRRRSRSTTTSSRRRRARASSATARPTSAPSTRRSTWPPIWHLPIVFQVINNRYGMGTSVEHGLGRARAVEARRGLPRCTASGSTATTCWPSARPPTGCSRRARDERAPSLLETMTYRFRGHSVADAGKVYRTRRGGRRRRRRATRSTASSAAA